MRVPNPSRPGFNQMPAILAGREDVLAAIDEAADVAALDGRAPRPVMITGTRGVGKTVVLERARASVAARYSWLSAAVEARPGGAFLPGLRSAVDRVRDAYAQHRPDAGRGRLTRATLRAGAPVFGAEAELTRSVPAGPDGLAESLERLTEAALPLQAGLMITLDEAHLAAKGELGELAAALQHAAVRGWPLVAVVAGLPSLQSPRRMVTYLERAEWHTLGLLEAVQARIALTRPARDAGRPMYPAAADALCAAAGATRTPSRCWGTTRGAGPTAATPSPPPTRPPPSRTPRPTWATGCTAHAGTMPAAEKKTIWPPRRGCCYRPRHGTVGHRPTELTRGRVGAYGRLDGRRPPPREHIPGGGK